jgi:transcriptional regulator GlxA family with amidase domain
MTQKIGLSLFMLFLITVYGSENILAQSYVCPPCPYDCHDDVYKEKGNCKVCNMELVQKESLKGIKTIAFYLQPGVEVLDFAGPMEVFASAGHKVFTVSKTKEPIVSQGILKIIPDYSIEDMPHADIIAFFGGNASNAYEDDEVIAWLQNLKNVDFHFSVCSGALILAEAVLLDGKTATTFHSRLDQLEEDYPKVTVKRNVRFVDNGNVITTAGVSAGIDGALHLVARLQGLEMAKRVTRYMEYDKWQPGEGLILTEDNPYIKVSK